MRVPASLFVALVLMVGAVPAASAGPTPDGQIHVDDTRHFDPNADRRLDTDASAVAERAMLRRARPSVGDERTWLASDDFEGTIYPKAYTLRGVGEHIEVWVASDRDDVSRGIDFPAGDCRNDGVRNVISDADVQYLIDEFDDTIYPTLSDALSVPPERNGARAVLADILGLPDNYYRGPGDRVVALVDNVRDDNFYDTNNSNSYTYTAGFFWGLFDDYLNRTVMTIDAWDWLHRTGANPPHDPTDDPCTSAPARPFLYEGVFAHEYQHLLSNYVDVDELSWVDEGLSEYAATITGYYDATKSIEEIGHESGVQCLLGYTAVQTPANPIPRPGGPENSLTVWGDQTDFEQEILCDYGAAQTFMLYLFERYGEGFMRSLHLDARNGLDSLARLLKQVDPQLRTGKVITRWALMLAVDKVLDAGWTAIGFDPALIQTDAFNADINWDNDQAYSAFGAPPNGSDYVRFRDAGGSYVSVDDVDSIAFDGATELQSLPLRWRVDRNPPPGSEGSALYSGRGDDLDRGLAFETRVPRSNPRLSFDHWYWTERGYDWAYVQVSDDGGETYRTISCGGTRTQGTLGPAYEGRSHGWRHETCNLQRYAGDRVVIAFRYVTDPGVIRKGWWVDDVMVGNHLVSSGASLAPFDSPTQINRTDVERFVVQLVAFHQASDEVRVHRLALDASFDGSLSGQELADAIGTSGTIVAAIVTYLDRTETVTQQAPYTLTVNGVVQPGGRRSSVGS